MSKLIIPDGVTPKFPPKIKLEFEFDCWSCPEATTHLAVFTFQDTTCDVSTDSDGDLGSVAGGLGGHFILRDSKRHLEYVLRPDHAWRVFQKALNQIEQQKEKPSK